MPPEIKDLLDANSRSLASTAKLTESTSRLAESNSKLADAVMQQSAAINKLVPVQERLQRDVHTLLINSDLEDQKRDSLMGKLDVNIALIKKSMEDIEENTDDLKDEVSDVKGDVRNVKEEVTRPRIRRPTFENLPEKRGKIAEALQEFEKLPTLTKVFILVLFFIVGFSGWLHKIVEAATG
jgi:predicted RNase H-like nuclease (RuvC/YqgF family)